MHCFEFSGNKINVQPHSNNSEKKLLPFQKKANKKSPEYEYIRKLNFCIPTSNKALFHAWYLASFLFPACIALSLNIFIIKYLGKFPAYYFGINSPTLDGLINDTLEGVAR